MDSVRVIGVYPKYEPLSINTPGVATETISKGGQLEEPKTVKEVTIIDRKVVAVQDQEIETTITRGGSIAE